MTKQRQALGAQGEAAVAAWYAARGWRLLARNWRVREGEIDLVVARGATVAFCEVKTRSSLDWGSPAEAVGRTKRRRLRRLGAMWLARSSHRPAEVRFDVATVVGADVDVIEGAF